jgi:Clp amino terminal domain, pathogenicity island component
MRDMGHLSGFVQGLVGGVIALIVLAVRSAIEGRSGVTFADLWTALAVGVAVGVVPQVLAWRVRGAHGPDHAEGSYSWGASTSRSRDHRSSGQFASGTGGMDRFDKFTDRARKVLTYAQDESQRFNHNYIGTEHLLLGLIREGDGVAALALGNMGVDLSKVRTAVEFIIGRGDRPVSGEIGLTPRGKRVIELAIDESRRLDHDYIGTEHLLLGIVRVGDGIAAGVLESLGVSLDRTRAEVIRAIANGEDLG